MRDSREPTSGCFHGYLVISLPAFRFRGARFTVSVALPVHLDRDRTFFWKIFRQAPMSLDGAPPDAIATVLLLRSSDRLVEPFLLEARLLRWSVA